MKNVKIRNTTVRYIILYFYFLLTTCPIDNDLDKYIFKIVSELKNLKKIADNNDSNNTVEN